MVLSLRRLLYCIPMGPRWKAGVESSSVSYLVTERPPTRDGKCAVIPSEWTESLIFFVFAYQV